MARPDPRAVQADHAGQAGQAGLAPPDLRLATVAGRLAELAQATPEVEVCGLVVAAPGGAPEPWPFRNGADDPSRGYLLEPPALLEALRRLDAGGLELLAVYHSHPAGGAGLSGRDLAGALCGGAPLLEGAAQLVVALEGGRAAEVRAHRWQGGRFEGVALWRAPPVAAHPPR